MSSVVSIERAASRRGVTLNFLGNLMVTPPVELVQMQLPIGAASAPTSVLVLVMDRQPTGCRLLLSDAGGAPAADFHLVSPEGQIPSEFSPLSMGQLAAFLARHVEVTDAVIHAGGVQHGDLTIARAVQRVLQSRDLDPAEALQEALDVSRSCEAWQSRIAQAARDVAAAS
ncbi:hypothetical protein [Ramlibacter sp. AN1133]|uniref:hypothetical protein n=1 Tax=Ramlibacter sp. AN1133 TaxID=3133429 RepID=UPI0030C17227